MDQEMEKDLISLLDEEGHEHQFEIVDAVELEDAGIFGAGAGV